jgi:hypothetical protein
MHEILPETFEKAFRITVLEADSIVRTRVVHKAIEAAMDGLDKFDGASTCAWIAKLRFDEIATEAFVFCLGQK